jgi:protein-disulfide isomerase
LWLDSPANLSAIYQASPIRDTNLMAGRSTNITEMLLVVCALLTTAAVIHRLMRAPQGADGRKVVLSQPDSLFNTLRLDGPRGSPRRLAVWTDYQCPACAQFEAWLGPVKSAFGDSLLIAYHHLPNVTEHPLSLQAAVMAECASRIGRFPQMHAVLFRANLVVRQVIPLDSITQALGLAHDTVFRACLNDSAISREIVDQAASAITLGIRGTPAILLGDSILIGALPPDRLIVSMRTH